MQRASYDLLDNTTIVATTATTPTKITMTGSIYGGPMVQIPIDSSLEFKEATVPMTNVSTGAFAGWRSIKVLMFKVVTSNPQGKKIGQILTYHLGLEAQSRGIDYIVASDVTAAREPFYTPLGFKDVLDAPPWKTLDAEKTEIDGYLRDNPSAPDFGTKLLRRQAVVDMMAKNRIYISAADLVANSKLAWSRLWRAS